MTSLKTEIAQRIRARRHSLGLTVRALAEASGLSPRYVISAEHGQANLSMEKLLQLCRALDLSMSSVVSAGPAGEVDALLAGRSPHELAEVAAWLRQRFGARHRPLIALLGVRGAGKSAVGQRLAASQGVPFVELDERVERVADLSLSEIFALHGEAYYRRAEYKALNGLINEGGRVVVATGGGIVTHQPNFDRLREAATTVWLRARPEDHWNRVIQQGDRRPMRDHPHAMADLRALLAARSLLYGLADVIVDTTDRSLPEVVEQVTSKLAKWAGVG
jgi:XRE family aerobic/anaerobic benzoate catabolism transcriptional regulator